MTDQANTHVNTSANPNVDTNIDANEDAGLQAMALADYHQVELQAEDLDAYNELGLPLAHPHLFAKSLLAQLARLPMLELNSEQEIYSQHTVALSA